MEELVIAIFGGVISKVINDIADVSNIKNKIVEAVKNKFDKHQNFESQIYNVIVDVLNRFTDDKYKNNQDKIYEAAGKIFIEFSKDKDEIEAVKVGLSLLVSDVTEGRCKDFIEKFDEAVCKDEVLRERIQSYLLKKGIKISENGFEQAHNDANEIKQGINEIKHTIQEYSNISNKSESKVESRTQEYLDKWTANMFLNDFTEWDKNKGENIKLSDVYIEEHLPHFFYGDNEKPFCNIHKLLSEYILNNNDDNKMLLILGQPGIGKSTLITWIVANFKNKRNDILVYRFVSDLKNIDWGQYHITDEILKALNLDYDDLYNKTLILDGFDEINVAGDRKEILDKIYWK